mmetsp:Transcript_74533/g.125656  ORF Transcript_74533/g.125656 Transcript_74533/m.125656 type:complete len:390 (+) Transcript_74533:1276-2445(+)
MSACAVRSTPHAPALLHRGEHTHGLGRGQELRVPVRGDGLDLREEAHRLLPVEVVLAADGPAGPGEREHRERHGDGDVDAHLPHVNLVRELPGGRAARREEGGAVALGVAVDERDGVVQVGGLEAAEHRPKDLLCVALHVGLHTREDRGAHEVPALEPWDRVAAAVQGQSASVLLGGPDEGLCALLGLDGDQRPHVNAGRSALPQFEGLGLLHEVGEPLLGFPHKHGGGEGHAPLPRGAEGGPCKTVDHMLLVGVREDHRVVLRSKIGLHALAICSAAGMDVTSGSGAPDERNRTDLRVIADEVHCLLATVNDVQDSIREPSLFHQLCEHHRGSGVSFRGLEDEGVAAGQGRGVHPQGDHSREVEWGNASADTERLPVADNVHVRRHVL